MADPTKLVYSPHVYGRVAAQHTPFEYMSASTFPRNLPSVWDAHWGGLPRDTDTPVLVGEVETLLHTWLDASLLLEDPLPSNRCQAPPPFYIWQFGGLWIETEVWDSIVPSTARWQQVT